MTTTTIDLDRQRAEFEAWAVTAAPKHSVERNDKGEYIDYPTHCAWAGFRAALATRQAAREQQEPVATVEETDIDVSVINAVLPIGTKLYLAAPVAQQSEAGDPLDWPIPCDLVDGAVTLKKGVKLRTVLTRLKFLSGLCKANLPKAYQYDVEHPNDGLNGQPTEAGAPTVAAEHPHKADADSLTVAEMVERLRRDAAGGLACNVFELDRAADLLEQFAPTSGRESAAPAAPVDREGAQQDAPAFDPVVEANRKLLLERSYVGMKKYGTTLADAGLSRAQLAQHALEEALDLANYLQTIIQTEEAQHG